MRLNRSARFEFVLNALIVITLMVAIILAIAGAIQDGYIRIERFLFLSLVLIHIPRTEK